MTFACRACFLGGRNWPTVRRLSDDPYVILGVPADASPAEIAAARRRLAQSAHPDHGGDVGAMQALNAAYDKALRGTPATERAPRVEPTVEPAPHPARQSALRVQHDSPSFVIDVAPVQAHEALMVAAASIGEVIVDSPPYMIECLLDEPIRCWCRLDITPEGACSSVSLIVERYDAELAPDIEAVRDAWVATLNRNERP
ncbi:hypothetical protein BH10ACT2_BH10ACT2_27860 [soil metagenome]